MGTTRAILVLAVLAMASAATAPAQALTVRDGSGAACSRPQPSRIFHVQGGCVLRAGPAPLDIQVRSPLGTFRFGTCRARMTLHFGSDGAVLIEQFDAMSSLTWPCDDFRACPPASVFRPGQANPPPVVLDYQSEPWRGRLRRTGDGRLAVRFRACVDSCLGRFQGAAEIELGRDGRGWKVVARDAGVGRGGLLLDGRWRVEGGDDLIVRP